MTTETADALITDWSHRLEQNLTEAGLEPQQARAHRIAAERAIERAVSSSTAEYAKIERARIERDLSIFLTEHARIEHTRIAHALPRSAAELAVIEAKIEQAMTEHEKPIQAAHDQQRPTVRLKRGKLLFMMSASIIGLLITLVVRAFT